MRRFSSTLLQRRLVAAENAQSVSGRTATYAADATSIVGRVWCETENWCSLCREPLNGWAEHRGKREHICLELVYDAIVRYRRPWTPHGVFPVAELITDDAVASNDKRDCRTAKRPFRKTRERRENSSDISVPPAPFVLDAARLFTSHDASDGAVRRQELFALLRHLVDAKILNFSDTLAQAQATAFSVGRAVGLYNIGLLGGQVLFKEMLVSLSRLFPRADAKDLSGITQMCASSYNCETVFDMCGLAALLIPRNAASPSGNENSASPSVAAALRARRIDVDDSGLPVLSYAAKGMCVRSILGQLRWAIEPDFVAPPPLELFAAPHVAQGSTAVRETYGVLAELAIRGVISELIDVRLTEYVCRAERVWHERGCERAETAGLDAVVAAGSDVAAADAEMVAPLANAGAVASLGDQVDTWSTQAAVSLVNRQSMWKPLS